LKRQLNFLKEIKLAKELAETFTEMMTSFEEFKTTNDTRLKEIEKKGAADVVITDKLAKIEQSVLAHEDANQKMTLAAAEAKKAFDEVKNMKDIIAKLEAKAGRPGAGGAVDEAAKDVAEYKGAFDSYCRKHDQYLTQDEVKTLTEYKTLLAGNDTLGGYYLSPPDMAADILKNVILMSPIRSLGRVSTIGVQSLKLPKRTGTFAATRVGEIAQRNETLGYTTGMVEIFAPEMYAEVHISQQMIEDQFFNIEAEMMTEFSEQFAVKEGQEFVTGTGTNNQAEGFLNATTIGGVAVPNYSGSATTIADAGGQANGMISMFYNGLKTAYARNATWVMRREVIGSVRKLKDGYGSYIWQPGVAANVPNTILGAPYVEVPDMPLEGAGTTPIAVGDFSKGYRIVDRVLMSVLRDPYTLASVGQILYRARKRVGGAVVLGEAIAKMTCHV
jgi:HK97 family phage major capsid protein